MSVYAWICFWILYSFPWIYMSIFVPIWHCLNYISITVNLNICYKIFQLYLLCYCVVTYLLFISYLLLAILDRLLFHINFRISLLISTRKIPLEYWMELHWICKSFWGRINIFYNINLLICEYNVSLGHFYFFSIFYSFLERDRSKTTYAVFSLYTSKECKIWRWDMSLSKSIIHSFN